MSKMNIHGAEYPIKKILCDEFVFSIPVYQRPYSWTTEQSEELYQDLLRAMGSGDKPTDDISPYFLGSIVLIKSDEPDAQVIDGQQRLTTLTMLLSAIRSLISTGYAESLTSFLSEKGNIITGTPERYRLKLRERDAEVLSNIHPGKGWYRSTTGIAGLTVARKSAQHPCQHTWLSPRTEKALRSSTYRTDTIYHQPLLFDCCLQYPAPTSTPCIASLQC